MRQAVGEAAIPRVAELRAELASHASALCSRLSPVTAPGGAARLHQLVNDSSSFAETSSTAMLVWSLAWALESQLLAPDDRYTTCLTSAWEGVAAAVQADGSVVGICQGMPIWPNATKYKSMAQAYEASACGGLGSVLSAAAAMESLARSAAPAARRR